jgi:hypothetical protein
VRRRQRGNSTRCDSSRSVRRKERVKEAAVIAVGGSSSSSGWFISIARLRACSRSEGALRFRRLQQLWGQAANVQSSRLMFRSPRQCKQRRDTVRLLNSSLNSAETVKGISTGCASSGRQALQSECNWYFNSAVDIRAA